MIKIYLSKTTTIGFLIFLLALMYSTSVFAQKGNITGVINKRENGKPLGGASVKLDGADRTTVTDANGKYSFNSVEADKKYQIIASKDRYNQGATEVTVKADTDNEASTIALQRMPINTGKFENLLELLGRKKYKEFEKELNEIIGGCEDVDDEECNLVDEAKSSFNSGDIANVKSAITKLARR